MTGTDGRRDWLWFVAWAVAGGAGTLSLLTLLTVGVYIAPVVVVGVVLLVRRPAAVRGLPGLVSGISLPLFYVAFLNRSGPGTVCSALAGGGQECSDEWSPWPWLVSGLLLFALGALTLVLVRRRSVGLRPGH
ncbi:hypothetical protein [Streptacidiphilus sp. EB129]|uniref:hypothetical protein n=1 Tax=Streptacidiphilus sp. EB129 TaxID=3156262 RepID=UPI003513DC41